MYRSVLCYENVLKLKPDLKMAIRKMHGIQCLSKLEKALETQHSVLQNTLTELKDQQRKFEEWNQLQEKIVNAQANVGQRLRSQLEYQEFRFRSTKIPPRNDYSFNFDIISSKIQCQFFNSIFQPFTIASSTKRTDSYFSNATLRRTCRHWRHGARPWWIYETGSLTFRRRRIRLSTCWAYAQP